MNDFKPEGSFASPPCFMHELDDDTDSLQAARDVARWRRAERKRLIEERVAIEHVIGTRIIVAAGRDQQFALVARGADDRDHRRIGKRTAELLGDPLQLGVEIDGLAALGRIGRSDHPAATADAEQAIDVGLPVGDDRLAPA